MSTKTKLDEAVYRHHVEEIVDWAKETISEHGLEADLDPDMVFADCLRAYIETVLSGPSDPYSQALLQREMGYTAGDIGMPDEDDDFERSTCPSCGSPDCTFPKECQDGIGVWPEPRYGEE